MFGEEGRNSNDTARDLQVGTLANPAKKGFQVAGDGKHLCMRL